MFIDDFSKRANVLPSTQISSIPLFQKIQNTCRVHAMCKKIQFLKSDKGKEHLDNEF
jgi:hypothetical protein